MFVWLKTKVSGRCKNVVFYADFDKMSPCTATGVLMAIDYEMPLPDYVKTFNIVKYRYGNVYMFSNVYDGINEDDAHFGIFEVYTDFFVATNARYLTSELGDSIS